MKCSSQMYTDLHSIVFRADYPGYRPTVLEIPNGDGKTDTEKRFAHIAEKYLKEYQDGVGLDILNTALDMAHAQALEIAKVLNVPEAMLPVRAYSNMRVLEYPIGAISNEHTDFDLFTLMFYRNTPESFVALERQGVGTWTTYQGLSVANAVRNINEQFHMGEIGELINLGPATPHKVIASDKVQHSIVYFAIPDHAAVLPNGITVGDWLVERISRSRINKDYV